MNKNTIIILIFAIIALVAVVVVVTLVKKIIKGLRATSRAIRSTVRTFEQIGDTMEVISDMAKSRDSEPETPQPKTVGGATSMFLEMIKKDFPGYHNSDAESDIQAVLRDYLSITHEGKNDFEKNTVNANVMRQVPRKTRGTVSNINFHRTSIYNYQKSLDYATIAYRCAIGYKLNGTQIETRYEVLYSLQLKEHGVATEIIKCKNCNAPLDNFFNNNMSKYTTTKNDGVCPYCGTKIIRDTIMSWNVTRIAEIP